MSTQEPESTSLSSSNPTPDTPQRRVGLQALKGIREYLYHTLNIQEGTDIPETQAGIRRDIVFQGPRVWILICSIFIASIGLNTNSGAVIIGAMLISPLMGPILGIGLAVGTNDFPLLKRALYNFGIMVVISLATATVYFLITPLREMQDELISRTRPTTLDVFVALFGGMAGIIAGSRTEKSNVIPGVAIATALMPPLCTAGFGIATGSWSFFIGAFYLFLLNCVIISLSTFVVVRYLRFPMHKELTETQDRKSNRLILIFTLLVIIPSGFLFVQTIQESYFFNRADNFIESEFKYPGTNVVNRNIVYGDTAHQIEVFLMGQHIPMEEEERLGRIMRESYGLEKANLKLVQAEDAASAIAEMSDRVSQQTRAGIIEDLFKKNEAQLIFKDSVIADNQLQMRLLQNEIIRYRGDSIPFHQIQRELNVSYPNLARFGFSRTIESDLNGVTDTIPTVLVNWDRGLSSRARREEEQKLRDWLQVRLNLDTLRVIAY